MQESTCLTWSYFSYRCYFFAISAPFGLAMLSHCAYLFLSLFAAALPKPPTSLVISDVTATSVKLTWNPGNVDPIESYVIQYKRKYTPGELFEEISAVTNTEYTITGLHAYTVYEFRILAVNNIGRGIPSNPVDVTTGELG